MEDLYLEEWVISLMIVDEDDDEEFDETLLETLLEDDNDFCWQCGHSLATAPTGLCTSCVSLG